MVGGGRCAAENSNNLTNKTTLRFLWGLTLRLRIPIILQQLVFRYFDCHQLPQGTAALSMSMLILILNIVMTLDFAWVYRVKLRLLRCYSWMLGFEITLLEHLSSSISAVFVQQARTPRALVAIYLVKLISSTANLVLQHSNYSLVSGAYTYPFLLDFYSNRISTKRLSTQIHYKAFSAFEHHPS